MLHKGNRRWPVFGLRVLVGSADMWPTFYAVCAPTPQHAHGQTKKTIHAVDIVLLARMHIWP